MTQTSASRTSKGVISGTVSQIEPREMGGDEILVGQFTFTQDGETRTLPFSAAGEHLAAVRHLLVEGGFVALYGAVRSDYFKVIGPDLRKRTIAENAPAAAARKPLTGKALGAVIARRRLARAA